MNMMRKLSMAMVVVALVSACDSGDINIEPSTVDTSTDNSVNNSNNTSTPTPTTNPCASYTNTGGQTIQGVVSGDNCTYAATFVDVGNELTTDMTIPALPNGGAHIFSGSLIVGQSCDSDACLTAAGITDGGDGPELTIEAGATLAFASNAQYVTIHRGSQINAIGTATAPITFTSLSDIQGTVGPEDVQEWGGMIIAGFGIDNGCAYSGTLGTDLALVGECHNITEGLSGLNEVRYGGINNADNSGRLEYVVVKHTGNQIATGNELNGITFAGVGSNTTVNFLEVYSTYDDGIEIFGGAVNINNFVAMYARDDSIDIDSGYQGTITNALVIQSAGNANHCIESDGIDDFSNRAAEIESVIAQGINSRPTINNLTCIINATSEDGVAPEAPNTHGQGAGWRIREGIFPTINDSMIIGSFADKEDATETNYCVRVDNRSQQGLVDGDVDLNSNIFSCYDNTNGQSIGATTIESLIAANNQFALGSGTTALNPTAALETGFVVLEGTPPISSVSFATMLVGGVSPTNAPVGTASIGTTFTSANLGWTYGILDSNRGQALWFE